MIIQTRVVLQDTKKMLDERLLSLRNTVDFEFNLLKDRIMELEEERQKLKQKTNDLKFQLQRLTKWRALAELELTREQKKEILEELKQKQIPILEDTGLNVLLPGEKPSKKFDYLSKLQFEVKHFQHGYSEAQVLWMWLPQRVQQCEAVLLFTTDQHGRSMQTFYKMCADQEPTILVVKTTENQVFGAFCSHAWVEFELVHSYSPAKKPKLFR